MPAGDAEMARQRLEEMLADPFGQQVLRDLVPRGAQITAAASGRPLSEAIQVAMRDSHGLPAFLAIIEPGRVDLSILVVEAGDKPGRVTLRRPGDWAVAGTADPDATLAELAARLREANEA